MHECARLAVMLSSVALGCGSPEPRVVAEPDVGSGPAHLVTFDITNGTDECYELQVWLDGQLVIEGTVQERGEECFRHDVVELVVGEGLHALQFDPRSSVLPFEVVIDADTIIGVAMSATPAYRYPVMPFGGCR